MVWEGDRSRLCKCNNFNGNGLFGRDRRFEIPHGMDDSTVILPELTDMAACELKVSTDLIGLRGWSKNLR